MFTCSDVALQREPRRRAAPSAAPGAAAGARVRHPPARGARRLRAVHEVTERRADEVAVRGHLLGRVLLAPQHARAAQLVRAEPRARLVGRARGGLAPLLRARLAQREPPLVVEQLVVDAEPEVPLGEGLHHFVPARQIAHFGVQHLALDLVFAGRRKKGSALAILSFLSRSVAGTLESVSLTPSVHTVLPSDRSVSERGLHEMMVPNVTPGGRRASS